MKGYTIENSIDLLEKDVKALKEGGGGGGGASTWNQLQGKPFNALGEELYNLDGDLTVNTISADKIALPESSEHSWDYLSQAIEALAEDVNHFSDDIAELGDKFNYSTDEIEIGTYYNGKTLYRRAFVCPSLINKNMVNGTWLAVDEITPASGIKQCIKADCVWVSGETDEITVTYPLVLSTNYAGFGGKVGFMNTRTTNTVFYKPGILILEYTK